MTACVPGLSMAGVGSAVEYLVEENWPLVRQLVQERLANVPGHITRDELMSAGLIALVVSAQGYNPDRGVPFVHFAAIRIRGALMDELRAMDWATRSVRRRARDIDTVHNQLAATLRRTPHAGELAAAMGVEVSELEGLQSDLARAKLLSLEGLPSGAGDQLLPEVSAGPESLILLREKLGYLHGAIAELPDRLRLVVVGYYLEQRPMTGIAAELGVTESRVSQLCAQALRMLRDGMNSQLDPLIPARPCQSRRAAAAQQAYFGAIADHGSLQSRLALSTAGGDMLTRTRPR